MLNDSVCPDCGRSWADFRREHELGCPSCYASLRLQLKAHLSGRCGQRDQPGPENLHDQVQDCRRHLLLRAQEAAVAREDYEEAARLRTLLTGGEA